MTRDIQIVGDAAYIPLTQGFTAVIDAADAALVSGLNWHAWVRRRPDQSIVAYAVRNDRAPSGKRRLTHLHRVLTSAPPHIEVDHRDGDGMNNRRSNLRLATTSQNQFNARIRADSSSGIKGVGWCRANQKWRAYITVDGKRRYLGWFAAREDAAAVCAKARAELHGEFGRSK